VQLGRKPEYNSAFEPEELWFPIKELYQHNESAVSLPFVQGSTALIFSVGSGLDRFHLAYGACSLAGANRVPGRGSMVIFGPMPSILFYLDRRSSALPEFSVGDRGRRRSWRGAIESHNAPRSGPGRHRHPPHRIGRGCGAARPAAPVGCPQHRPSEAIQPLLPRMDASTALGISPWITPAAFHERNTDGNRRSLHGVRLRTRAALSAAWRGERNKPHASFGAGYTHVQKAARSLLQWRKGDLPPRSGSWEETPAPSGHTFRLTSTRQKTSQETPTPQPCWRCRASG